MPGVLYIVLKRRSRLGFSAKNIRGRGKIVEDREVKIRSIRRSFLSWNTLYYTFFKIPGTKFFLKGTVAF